MNYLRLSALVALSFFLLPACKKLVEYPIIPSISFKSLATSKDAQGFDKSVFVTIAFTDGDGDIGYYSTESGLNDPIFDDSLSMYYRNFIVKAFLMQNGVWTLLPYDFSARIPYLTPDGKNKALKGDIQRELDVPLHLVNDTMHYEIFIYDRSLHQSNTITTPDFILNTQ